MYPTASSLLIEAMLKKCSAIKEQFPTPRLKGSVQVQAGQFVEEGTPIAQVKGCALNNFGIPGAGAANAADALAAVQKFIFEVGSICPADLIAALDSNFQGFEGSSSGWPKKGLRLVMTMDIVCPARTSVK